MQIKKETRTIKVLDNINKILLGTLVTLVAHNYSALQRGYRAIGGEFLLVPLLFGVRFLYLGVKESLKKDIKKDKSKTAILDKSLNKKHVS